MFRAILLLFAVAAGVVAIADHSSEAESPTLRLDPVAAVGARLDTLLIGGYAEGRFVDAVQALGGDLSEEERLLVGEHLDRIFAEKLGSDGLGGNGRLRVAYERALRPDGSTRSIRVLGAEVASAGRLHTAYYFERDGSPGYFDPFGASLDVGGWDGPLRAMRVSSPFGRQRMHPILGRILPHTGIDYAAPRGEPVRATADGIVLAAGPRGGYGLLVELGHPNGYGTRYAHLDRIAEGVQSAGMVRRGDVIGFVGMTGLATGPHLHYEVRRRGQPVDPVRVATAGGPGADLGADGRWSRERHVLTDLLARAPTIVVGLTN